PGGQHPGGRRWSVAGDLPVVKLVEEHAPAVGRERNQVGRETAVVRQSKIAVAKHQRVCHRNKLPGTEGGTQCPPVAVRVAKQRHMRRQRLEGEGRRGAREGTDPAEDGRRGGSGGGDASGRPLETEL